MDYGAGYVRRPKLVFGRMDRVGELTLGAAETP